MTDTHDITLRLGTRASPLAVAQAEEIARRIEAASGGAIGAELVRFTTTGDQLTSERLINVGGKGLFTKELDRALDAGEIDVAVHSLKDVPSALPAGQVFIAFPQREDARDAFISPHVSHPRDLPQGAILGTASLRREAQSLRARPDLKVVSFRGNVQTRLRKLEAGEAAGTYLALAGLNRLGMAHIAYPMDLDEMLPAPAQGIIACVARDGALPALALAAFAAITDPDTESAAWAERAVLRELDGSCRTPIGAHLFQSGKSWRLSCEVLAPDGQQHWRADGEVGTGADAETLSALGQRLGREIREAAGGDLPAFRDDG